jgi:hypothetical protein
MAAKKPDAIDVVMQAYRESNGAYIDVVVEHGLLPGLKIEHLKLWDDYIHIPKYYKMWHPKDHISHSMKTVEENGKPVTYMYAEERIGDYGASKMCLRKEPVDSAPVKQKYKPVATNTSIGPGGETLGGVYHEMQPTDTGIIMRTTFRLPAKIPKDYVEAMKKHSLEEMANFPKFLPELYGKRAGNSK